MSTGFKKVIEILHNISQSTWHHDAGDSLLLKLLYITTIEWGWNTLVHHRIAYKINLEYCICEGELIIMFHIFEFSRISKGSSCIIIIEFILQKNLIENIVLKRNEVFVCFIIWKKYV